MDRVLLLLLLLHLDKNKNPSHWLSGLPLLLAQHPALPKSDEGSPMFSIATLMKQVNPFTKRLLSKTQNRTLL
jgi:hypothetical protein